MKTTEPSLRSPARRSDRSVPLPSAPLTLVFFPAANNARQKETTLKTAANAELNNHAYLYNVGNQRTRQTRTDDSYVTYTYDDAGELRTAYTTNSGGSEVTSERYMFGYDAAWNMIKRTNNASVTTYTVNNLNQATSVYSYDSNGNPTSISSTTYTYDDENRLIQVLVSGSVKTDFLYDARGRLRKRIEYTWGGSSWFSGVETRYVYDGMLSVQERNSSNVPTVNYTRGPDLSGTLDAAGGIGGLLARSSSYQSGSGAWNTHNYYHADANGNITYMMQNNETVYATYKYDPFGRTISSSGTGASANLYRFSSKEIHSNSGFYYYGYRFYDPNTQRWLNRDPVKELGHFTLRNQIFADLGVLEKNLYTMALNVPVSLVDPLGLAEHPWPANGQVCNLCPSEDKKVYVLINGQYYELPAGECTASKPGPGNSSDVDGVWTCNPDGSGCQFNRVNPGMVPFNPCGKPDPTCPKWNGDPNDPNSPRNRGRRGRGGNRPPNGAPPYRPPNGGPTPI